VRTKYPTKKGVAIYANSAGITLSFLMEQNQLGHNAHTPSHARHRCIKAPSLSARRRHDPRPHLEIQWSDAYDIWQTVRAANIAKPGQKNPRKGETPGGCSLGFFLLFFPFFIASSGKN
jgi:hypothetical protein